MIRPQNDPAEGGLPRRPLSMTRAWTLKVTLEGSEPPVWRRIAVDQWTTLTELHRIFQVVMGWVDLALWAFEVGDVIYEELDMDAEGENATFTAVGELRLEPGQRFLYRYDFEADWVLGIEVEKVTTVPDVELLPWVLEGERAGPPETVGGPVGFREFLEAIADKDHPKHDHYHDWVGEGHDPERFDCNMANTFLGLAMAWGAIGSVPWIGDG
jgi:hypothetical protein